MHPLLRTVLVNVFFLFFPVALYSQSNYEALKSWDEKTIQSAMSGTDADYLSSDEKEIIFLCNLARLNGILFESTFLKQYLDTCKIKYGKKWTTSLKKDLKALGKVDPFLPSAELAKEAEKHALDMGRSGKTGHNASHGDKPEKRFAHLENNFSEAAENCHYGSKNPLIIVIELLIDDKIKNLGHRKNLLSANLNRMGVSIKPHKKYRFNCVMDFGKSK